MSTPLLELRSVERRYRLRGVFGAPRYVTAVDRVNLDVDAGEIVALVGESGAGKSTLGRIVLGLERPDAGSVRFEGTNLAELSRTKLRLLRQRMHMLFQDPYQSFHPGMRIAEVVEEPLVIARTPRPQRRDRIRSALMEVDLEPDRFSERYPHELSGGQRQRVGLARAIVGQPRLVVADEPTSMLDVSVQAGILDLMLALRSAHQTSFLVITHDLAVARHVAGRIAVMLAGQIVEVGTAEQIIERPIHDYTRALVDAVEELTPPVASARE